MAKTDRSTRAGRYERQPTGYRAFMPVPLPPDPPVRLEGELQSLLSQADRGLGRLDGSVLTLPNPLVLYRLHRGIFKEFERGLSRASPQGTADGMVVWIDLRGP
jgi:hypothetical protein